MPDLVPVLCLCLCLVYVPLPTQLPVARAACLRACRLACRPACLPVCLPVCLLAGPLTYLLARLLACYLLLLSPGAARSSPDPAPTGLSASLRLFWGKAPLHAGGGSLHHNTLLHSPISTRHRPAARAKDVRHEISRRDSIDAAKSLRLGLAAPHWPTGSAERRAFHQALAMRPFARGEGGKCAVVCLTSPSVLVYAAKTPVDKRARPI